MMKLLLSSSLCFSLLLGSSPVAAEDPAPLVAPAILQAKLTHGGAVGMWFRMDRAKLILTEVKLYRALDTKLIPKLELRVELAKLRIGHLKAALASAESAEQASTEALEAAVRGRREAEEARDSIWSGQPFLWGLLGSLGVSIAVIVTK